jgi:hypothetical protein
VDGWIIFEGEDFAGSPMDADDSDETVAALLTFLTLRRGDTDAEYFESYTPEQLAWTRSYDCEVLACELSMLDDGEPEPDAVSINGVACHERGCWREPVECRWCGESYQRRDGHACPEAFEHPEACN